MDGLTTQPNEKQMSEWLGQAQRISPYGTARQLVTVVEVEVWANDDRSLAPDVVGALEKFMDQASGLESGSEVVLRGGNKVRVRFVNRYFEKGKLIGVEPRPDAAAEVAKEGLQA